MQKTKFIKDSFTLRIVNPYNRNN